MNERDTLRYASRRAALREAIRTGDAPMAARAAARIRVAGAPLVAAELALAREARRVLGRAIVNARLPKQERAPLARVEAISAPRPSRRRHAYVAAALAAALLVFLLGGSGLGPAGEPGGAPPAAAADQQRVALVSHSLGRTISLPAEVVAVQESPTPAPTEAPTASPAAQPTTAPATAGSGSGARTGTPAPTGTGAGGGGTGGGGIGILPRTPTPAPTRTPVVPPPGFGRFSVIVLDASNGRPLPDVCVVLGTSSCDPGTPHTDLNGRWSADVPVTAGSTNWDMSFMRAGYRTQKRLLTLAAGRTVTFQILLRRTS